MSESNWKPPIIQRQQRRVARDAFGQRTTFDEARKRAREEAEADAAAAAKTRNPSSLAGTLNHVLESYLTALGGDAEYPHRL